jgi:hypothetical protein
MAIAPSSAHLLVEAIERLRHAKMKYGSDIGLIHTDPEGGSGHDDIRSELSSCPRTPECLKNLTPVRSR